MSGKSKFDIKFLIIIILIIIILLEKCGDQKAPDIVSVDGKKYELLKYTVDTVKVFKTYYGQKKGEDIYHDVFEIDTAILYRNVIDTEEVIKDYFITRVYKDTIKLKDSLGIVFIIDTINKNNLVSRNWYAEIVEKKIKETSIVGNLPKNNYYLGLDMNLDKIDFLNSVGTSLLIKSKNNNIYQIKMGLTNKQNMNTSSQMVPYFGGGVYWQLNK